MTEKHPTTGRTAWDFATEVLGTIGRLGPAVIIVTGFLIFAYLFYQELNKARFETGERLQAQVKDAQDQLIELYDQIEANREKFAELERNSRTELESTQQLLRDEQNKLAMVNAINIIFGRIRNDINTFVEKIYLPYLIERFVLAEYGDFKQGAGSSLFSELENAFKNADDPEIQNMVIRSICVFLQVVQAEVEQYRQDRLAPVEDLEYGTRLEKLEADLQKIQMVEKNVATMVERARGMNTDNYTIEELDMRIEQFSKELDSLTKGGNWVN